jgi:hypothetical protein
MAAPARGPQEATRAWLIRQIPLFLASPDRDRSTTHGRRCCRAPSRSQTTVTRSVRRPVLLRELDAAIATSGFEASSCVGDKRELRSGPADALFPSTASPTSRGRPPAPPLSVWADVDRQLAGSAVAGVQVGVFTRLLSRTSRGAPRGETECLRSRARRRHLPGRAPEEGRREARARACHAAPQALAFREDAALADLLAEDLLPGGSLGRIRRLWSGCHR